MWHSRTGCCPLSIFHYCCVICLPDLLSRSECFTECFKGEGAELGELLATKIEFVGKSYYETLLKLCHISVSN